MRNELRHNVIAREWNDRSNLISFLINEIAALPSVVRNDNTGLRHSLSKERGQGQGGNFVRPLEPYNFLMAFASRFKTSSLPSILITS